VYVPIDVELKTRGDTAENAARWVWYILVFIWMIQIWIVGPIVFAFYETDEKKTVCARLWDALRLQLPLFITLAVLLVPTFFFCNEVRIPAKQAAMIDKVPNEEIDGEMYYVDKNSIVQHAYVVSVLLGQFIIGILGGLGIIFLPYNLLNDFIFRPKPLSEAGWEKRQRILLPKLINLRKETKRLETDRM
jgi:hypothetical protein